jgi:hypothetical protein
LLSWRQALFASRLRNGTKKLSKMRGVLLIPTD